MLNIIATILLLFGGGPFPKEFQQNLTVFSPGERLQYKVKWLFFRLGTIVVATDSVQNDPGQYKVNLLLDSNPDLFFFSIHNRYEVTVNENPLRCESLIAREADGEDTLVTTYRFAASTHQVEMEQRLMPADTVLKSEVMDSIDFFFEGSSLFFFARSMLHTTIRYSAPTMVDLDLFTTDITFTDRIVPVSINALDEDIETKELYGRANFEGKSFGGFSGDFRGWFSNDEAAIPIRAEMSITLGSVNVELEQWSRAGWSPPIMKVSR